MADNRTNEEIALDALKSDTPTRWSSKDDAAAVVAALAVAGRLRNAAPVEGLIWRTRGDFIDILDPHGNRIGMVLRGWAPDGPAALDVVKAIEAAVAAGLHDYSKETK